jgi:hypothetical protein
MSNKTTKRIALGVIASLVFAPFAALAPASALTASATATVGPVRVSATAGVQDAVPAASFAFTVPDALAGDALTDGDTSAVLTVTTAPSATADVTIIVNGDTLTDDVAGAPSAGAAAGEFGGSFAENTAYTGTIAVTGTASGTYAGTLVITDATNGATDEITINWSFTTVGAPASISLSPTSVALPAVDDDNTNFVTSKAVTVSLLDAAGKVTQAGTGDSILASIGDNTNIGLTNVATGTSVAITDSNLSDGKHDVVVGSKSTTADAETVTFTPRGVLPSLNVAAVTLSATTTGYGVETAVDAVLTTPSATNLVKAGTAAGSEAAYTVDTSVRTLVYTVSGYTSGAAYKITVDGDGTTNNFTVADNTSNTTATAAASADVVLYGIVGATGTVVVTVVMSAVTAADTVGLDANSDGDNTDARDALVTFTAAAYSVAVTTPAVTPTLAVTSTAVAMAGKVADTYGNPVSGAVVTVTGTVTPTGTAITGTATTATDGTWSLTMPATAAATTSVSLVAAAVKTGLTITSASAVVVNFNATGSPDTLTYADALSDQDTATTVNPVTTYPASTVIYTGSTGAGNSDEVYTIATAATDGTLNAEDVCVAFTPTTSPAGQVVVTGSAGVKFTTTSCATAQTLATLKDTVTVASGSAFYAVATKTGENSVTMTSGTKTASARFYAFNSLTAASAGDAIRNLTADKASLSLKPGEFAVITIAAKDAFGNAVKSAVAAGGATVTVTGAGSALVEGPTLSKQFTTTDANGNIMVGVVASQTPGTGTITITGTGAQLKAAAGSATSATAGTNGLTAASSTVTVSVTVAAVEPEVVYEKPTLNIAQKAGRVILSGTAENEEGDIIVYIKRIGKTAWVERAKTFEVAAPGDFNGSIKAPKGDVVIRVKQEGTGLFSNQVIVLKP